MREWPLPERLRGGAGARHGMAARRAEFAAAIAPELVRTEADTLVSELLPLLDACKFLEREAGGILRTRRLGRWGRPAWLMGVSCEVRRAAWGHVVVIAPANFPLLLAGVQVMQALVAGNRVTWKPGRGGGLVAGLVESVLRESGLPEGWLRVTEESVEAGEAAVGEADFVVFTGSAANGKRVMARLAETATPCVMELSGCDAMVVLGSAAMDEVRRALRFGLRLNGGEVCMRPRRVVGVADVLRGLQAEFGGEELEWVEAEGEDAILLALGRSEFALTVAIFCGDAEMDLAQRLSERVTAGVVVVNDLIAPTADPRAPFGGRGASGFGVTRGAEGLLAMTTPKVVYVRKSGGRARHYEPTGVAHRGFFSGWIRAVHGGGWAERWQGMMELVRHGRELEKAEKR